MWDIRFRPTSYALDLAAAKGHLKVVRYFVEKSDDPYAARCMEHALMKAAMENRLNVVTYFHEQQHRNRRLNFGAAVQVAARHGGLQVVKYLFKVKSALLLEDEPDDGLPRVGEFDAYRAHWEVVKGRPEMESYATSALSIATFYGHMEVAAYIQRWRSHEISKQSSNDYIDNALRGGVQPLLSD
jgi:hypothetical protein